MPNHEIRTEFRNPEIENQQYPDEISEEDIKEIVDRANKIDAKNTELSKAMSIMGGEKKDGNFLHLQISTEQMLDKLEHFYRGDKIVEKNGNTFWQEQTDKDLITFNEFGVTSLMEIVTKYIDRNTILSYYTEERIYQILGDIGDELTLFVLCNYNQIGMNTYFKKTKFRIIITTTLHIIESTYRRALRGKTIEELNQSRVVGQFGDINNQRINQNERHEGWIKRQFSRI